MNATTNRIKKSDLTLMSIVCDSLTREANRKRTVQLAARLFNNAGMGLVVNVTTY